MSRHKVLTDFEVSKSLGSLYTGGHVEWLGDLLFTTASGAVNIVQNGSVLHRVEEEEDPVLNFTVAKDTTITLITAHKSGLLRQYRIDELAAPEVVKTFRSIHTGPIAVMKIHLLPGGGRILGTGGTDGTVKVWDLDQQYYTHNFRTGSGVCTTIEFHPTKLLVVTGFQSGGLYSWDLTNSKQIHSFQGHYSAVTGAKMLVDRKELLSAGRDKVVIIWSMETGEKKRTIPVSCSVEGVYVVPNTLQVVLGSGDSLVLWDLEGTPRRVKQLEIGAEITGMESRDQAIYCATIDQNLVEVDVAGWRLVNTVVGNNDEILALGLLGAQETHLVVACNSPAIRLYKVCDFTCSLVYGHKDTVMCVSVSPLDKDVVCTGGKDREVRVWRLEAGLLNCLVVGTGHTEAVLGLALANQSINQLYSVSKDTTVKVWKVDYDTNTMSSTRTEIAHEKEINCCDISPGDQLLATGSQDKTCKLWDRDLGLVATLRGHKRGIWCAKFSPADQLVATGSADATIRLWSLTEFIVLKQLEGHDCSVLSLVWIADNQIASSATDGLIKVWWVTKQECVGTLDQHEDKVWSVVCRKQDGVQLFSGSADGHLVAWNDITEATALKKQEDASKIMVDQQKLSNLLASKQFGQALKLALRLSQPFTALKVLKQISYEEMEEAVLSLDKPALDQILGYTVKWNTNSKHCEAAQSVLHIVLTNYLPDDLLKLSGSREWVEGLLPYTEKHFQRQSRLQMKSKFTTFLIANMKATSLPQSEPEL